MPLETTTLKPFILSTIEDYDALLFDLDGTLIDSMPTHNRAWQMALAKRGVQISIAELLRLAGVPNLKTAEIFRDRYSLSDSAETIVEDKESLFTASLDSLRPLKAVADIAQTFYQKIPLAIVSGSTRLGITRTLEAVGLPALFNCVVSCEDTPQGKPHPAPYLLAAELLKVRPQNCLVFEDGAAGIQSARSANMSVVLVEEGQLFHWEDLR